MKDLKAVYFVWDSAGNPQYHDSLHAAAPMDGRTIEVTFTDGEKIVGRARDITRSESASFCFPLIPGAITFASSWSPEIPAKLNLFELFVIVRMLKLSTLLGIACGTRLRVDW